MKEQILAIMGSFIRASQWSGFPRERQFKTKPWPRWWKELCLDDKNKNKRPQTLQLCFKFFGFSTIRAMMYILVGTGSHLPNPTSLPSWSPEFTYVSVYLIQCRLERRRRPVNLYTAPKSCQLQLFLPLLCFSHACICFMHHKWSGICGDRW